MHGDGVCWRQAESKCGGKTLGWVIAMCLESCGMGVLMGL